MLLFSFLLELYVFQDTVASFMSYACEQLDERSFPLSFEFAWWGLLHCHLI